MYNLIQNHRSDGWEMSYHTQCDHFENANAMSFGIITQIKKLGNELFSKDHQR